MDNLTIWEEVKVGEAWRIFEDFQGFVMAFDCKGLDCDICPLSNILCGRD